LELAVTDSGAERGAELKAETKQAEDLSSILAKKTDSVKTEASADRPP
jgi:hypothetical protein